MIWWAWCVGGVILLATELGFIDAQFYLVFVGASALVVGILSAALPQLPHWGQWIIFAILAVVSLIAFRGRIYERLRRYPAVATVGPVGASLTAPVDLPAGDSCQVELNGSFWTVRNDTDAVIRAGTRVRVTHVHGLTLVIHPES